MKAVVKDIPLHTEVKDQFASAFFTEDMRLLINQTVDVIPTDGTWFTNEKFLFHKSWLTFEEEPQPIQPVQQPPEIKQKEKYTPEEDSKILELIKQDKATSEIAKLLNRSVASLRYRLNKISK